MNIVEWFDIKNPDHIEAYKYLRNMGSWPIGFIPDGTEFPPSWQIGIINKMAEEWIRIWTAMINYSRPASMPRMEECDDKG